MQVETDWIGNIVEESHSLEAQIKTNIMSYIHKHFYGEHYILHIYIINRVFLCVLCT